jgi:hypothetical protein
VKGLKKNPNREKEGGGKRKVEWSKRKSRIEKKKLSLKRSRGQSPTCSNGNGIETKANESFDNGVFFDIEAKRTCSIVIL